MNKNYIIKFSNAIFNDYIVIEKDLNEQVLKEVLKNIADILITCEDSFNTFLSNKELNKDISIEILDATDIDDIKPFNNYLLSFSNKYLDMLYTIQAQDKTIYCF